MFTTKTFSHGFLHTCNVIPSCHVEFWRRHHKEEGLGVTYRTPVKPYPLATKWVDLTNHKGADFIRSMLKRSFKSIILSQVGPSG